MIPRLTARLTLVVMFVMATSSCMREKITPVEREFEFGTHRVQVSVPAGWEALDQGRQKRFRKNELEIVLQNLGPSTSRARDLDELIDWGLAAVGQDQRREVKSRRAATVDGREAMDIETWNRLDHSNPHRFFFVMDDGEVLALHTAGMAFEDSLAAFDAIRQSLHFVSARR